MRTACSVLSLALSMRHKPVARWKSKSDRRSAIGCSRMQIGRSYRVRDSSSVRGPWVSALPRLGSRVRIPSPAPKTLRKMKCLSSPHKRGIVALVFGEARGKQLDKSPGRESSRSPRSPARVAERVRRFSGLRPWPGPRPAVLQLAGGSGQFHKILCRQHILVTEVLRAALKFLGGSAGFFEPEDQRLSE